MSQPIVLYDFDGNASPHKAWNPNTWKARYCFILPYAPHGVYILSRLALNMKGVKYVTEWLEYPDVEPVTKKLGVPPNGKRPDGSDLYTLPVIVDPNAGAAIVDSERIAEYLEKQYPNAQGPVLFPPGTKGLQVRFIPPKVRLVV